MQINISTRHGHLSTQTQEKISDKVTKLTRFHDRISSTVVTIDLENEERPDVEIQVTAEKARRFIASDQSDNLMNSVDSVIHKLEQQLKKHKAKLTKHRKDGNRAASESEPEQSL